MKQFIILTLLTGFFATMTHASAITESNQPENTAFAVFGAGCFWCVESEFQAIDGVNDVVSGYAGDTSDKANYQDVSTKKTNHYEVVRVEYDPQKVSYERLVEAFWLIHDPTQENGQGVDIGPQYKSVIMPLNDEQYEQAIAAKKAIDASGKFSKPVATTVQRIDMFYPAEDYHQDYYEKKGINYESVFDLGGESTTMKKRKRWFGGF